MRFQPSPYLLLSLTALFWSGNYVTARAMHASMPPVALSFWRWLLAAAILAPFCWRPVLAQWDVLRRHGGLIVVLGLLGVASFNTLVYIGLQQTTATHGVLLNSAIPVLIILIGAGCFGQRLNLLQSVGLLVSLGGVVTIISHGDWAVLQAFSLNVGDLWIMAAVVCWAVYTVLLRNRPAELQPMAFLGATVVIGVVAIFPLYVWELWRGRSFDLTPGNLAALGYVGLFPSVLAYFFWNRGVAEVGAAKAGLFIHLMPVFGTLLSVLFLGEQLYLYHVVGIAAILTGIVLTTRR